MMSVDKNHNPRKGTDYKDMDTANHYYLADKNHNPRKGTDSQS